MLRSWNLESYISDYTLKVIKVASICSAKITLLWNLTLLLWWWLLFVFSFSGWGNCMRLVWSGEQEGRQCLRLPPAPHILVFLIFFFYRNSEWQSSVTSVCHGGGYILLSTGLGFGAGDVFSRKRLKAEFQECFWGVGMFYYMGKGW